jgi:uncharacterized protein (TIGR00162 family)
MKGVQIIEKGRPRLVNPVLIEGLPGLGSVGRIVLTHLVRSLRAERFAELYSSHLPPHVLVDRSGRIRPMRYEFFAAGGEYSRCPSLILLTGQTQVQTLVGQYSVSEEILRFAVKKGAKAIITIGGYEGEGSKHPRVIVMASSRPLLEAFIKAGALRSPEGSPVVGLVGLLVSMAAQKKIPSACLLGETVGHFPDPRSAKSVLQVLARFLGMDIDLTLIDREILRAERAMKGMEKIEHRTRIFDRVVRRDDRITYIS